MEKLKKGEHEKAMDCRGDGFGWMQVTDVQLRVSGRVLGRFEV